MTLNPAQSETRRLLPPTLALTRLKVMCRGAAAYDERFHYGVNIIRGENGGGKSTIADFIFYILGGQLKQLKNAAAFCDEVIAELEFNRKPVVFRRQITLEHKASIYVFWGAMDVALGSPEGWQVYSAVRSATQESYSQLIFSLLGIPEIKNETDANVTIHQVLRALYVDQLSAVQSLLIDEAFDTAPMRSAIGAILYGVYNNDLFEDIAALKKLQNEHSEKQGQAEGIKRFLLSSNIFPDPEKLEKNKQGVLAGLKKIEMAIQKAINPPANATNADAVRAIEQAREEVTKTKTTYAALRDEADRLQLDIQDSEAFIAELKARLADLDESIAVHTIFGELPMTHCPGCLSVIRHHGAKENCPLCKEPLGESSRHSHALRMKHDIVQQIKESEELLQDKKQALIEEQARVAKAKELLEVHQQRLESSLSAARSTRDSVVDELFVEKGRLQGELEQIARFAQITSTLDQLTKQIAALKERIGSLSARIASRQREQADRLNTATGKVEEIALKLLKADLPREGAFQQGTRVDVSFAKNSFALDGRNNFSASSIFYLKTCVHFALLFASLELPFFRYPRFLLCDNMEDKGMERIRSENFQRVVVKLSVASPTLHQVIFTTSMIAPELNNSPYCVGDSYTKEHKSLRLPEDLAKLAEQTAIKLVASTPGAGEVG